MLGEVACSDLVNFFKVLRSRPLHAKSLELTFVDLHPEPRTSGQRHHIDLLARIHTHQSRPQYQFPGKFTIERLCPL